MTPGLREKGFPNPLDPHIFPSAFTRRSILPGRNVSQQLHALRPRPRWLSSALQALADSSFPSAGPARPGGGGQVPGVPARRHTENNVQLMLRPSTTWDNPSSSRYCGSFRADGGFPPTWALPNIRRGFRLREQIVPAPPVGVAERKEIITEEREEAKTHAPGINEA